MIRIKINNLTINTTINYKELVKSSKVDAVVISTPIKSHHEIALECIKYDKHIDVKKRIGN